MSEDRDRERRRLIEAILPHVAFDGWTHQAMAAGFADAGREAWEIQRYFPGGPADVTSSSVPPVRDGIDPESGCG